MRITIVGLACVVTLGATGCGEYEGPGEIEGPRIPVEVVAARAGEEHAAGAELARRAETAAPAKRILFGDLHVHTTFSADAFMMSLPFNAGSGAHPLADACDFARYCSALDFWSINDHAESLSARRWTDTKEAVRQCNAVAGDPASPDLVTFLGWEWTQIGETPANHYGHKNVIFRETAEDRVPTRPIAAAGFTSRAMRVRPALSLQASVILSDLPNHQRYLNFGEFQKAIQEATLCPSGVDVRELPAQCAETAATPGELFEKLEQWGFDTMVIPHGAAWGIYTPPGVDFSKHVRSENHDPDLQRLIEIHSGHGNSEEYRPWRAIGYDSAGNATCPEPTSEYEPCCWRAGEIIRDRCQDPTSVECEARVITAQTNFLAAGAAGRLTVPGTEIQEWNDCGECRDCFIPAHGYRPGNSAQLAMAAGDFTNPENPRHLTLGFISSSDNHSARPGTGYKEFARRDMTESFGPRSEYWENLIFPQRDPGLESLAPKEALRGILPNQTVDFERASSFFYTGGLVAVHSAGRDRDAIWNALNSREVYATSGERMLLWFDLVNAPDGVAPMGSELSIAESPRFRVRALGAPRQVGGCPDHALRGLSSERLEALCRGECYNPTDERKAITRIEVVRIRRQTNSAEPIESLIDDPWKILPCPAGGDGCVTEFIDPDFVGQGRAALYYVRAIQEAQLAVNAGGLRCVERDENGSCVETSPCYGGSRTALDDDCLADSEERAWSSPIFLAPRG
ncbi:MAG: hypothetical protein ACI8TX_000553 [Hyphomicrobiaceae bacterium]|jgi:hypothetical protein